MNTENNILLAEFMGFEVIKEKDFLDYTAGQMTDKTIIDSTLKYHNSWDWLMKVVDKIESVNDNEFVVEISDAMCEITGFEENADIKIYKCGGDKKDSVYNACIEFIRWYNKQNN